MNEKLKIAIQKSGRLNEDSLDLLKEAGISLFNGKDQLRVESHTYPLEVYYLRNGDIPNYLKDGVVDLAIIGENLLVEKGDQIPIIEHLGFSKCRVSIAVPKGSSYTSVNELDGKRIATSYPNTVRGFLTKNGIDADIHV